MESVQSNQHRGRLDVADVIGKKRKDCGEAQGLLKKKLKVCWRVR
jgi:hypothetical protein